MRCWRYPNNQHGKPGSQLHSCFRWPPPEWQESFNDIDQKYRRALQTNVRKRIDVDGFFFFLLVRVRYSIFTHTPSHAHVQTYARWVFFLFLLQKIVFEPSSSYVLKNLKPFSTYAFQLAARSKHGVGAFTGELSIQTPQSRMYTHPTHTHIQNVFKYEQKMFLESKTVAVQHFQG